MSTNPFAPAFEDLPETIPIFPLVNVLLLPCGNLPLNIFEPRYLAMVEDAMASNRIIGMVQPQDKTVRTVTDETPVFATGCAGRITEFSDTGDGRYLITLSGICRFSIREELGTNRGYRRIKACWQSYKNDLQARSCLDMDREKLKTLLRKYFENEGMECDWQAVDNAPDGKLITCLSMVCPFEAQEKQALLEAACCDARAKLFMTMLEMAACGNKDCNSRH